MRGIHRQARQSGSPHGPGARLLEPLNGMIAAVYSVKGGAGRTTIAVNIAAALGQKHRGDCLLLDLGLPYNHAALVANLVPTSCVALSDRAVHCALEAAALGAVRHHH